MDIESSKWRSPLRKRRWWHILLTWMIILTVTAICFASITAYNYPWLSGSNEDQYFDLNSGLHRIVKHKRFQTISDESSEGGMAHLYKKHYSEYPKPCWVIVNTFSLRSPTVSPHYRYHDLYFCESMVMRLFGQYRFDCEYERLLIAYALWSLKATKTDSSFSDIFYTIQEYAIKRPDGYILTKSDFPPDEAFTGEASDFIKTNPSLTPRAYGLDRFPELMQKIPPPY